jgi:hypothetical protein
VALIRWDNAGYLYLQVQRRREDEFIERNIQPRTKRFFNQARLTYISAKDIQVCFQQKVSLYSSLLYQNPEFPDANRLEDYVEPRHGSIREENIGHKDVSFSQEHNGFLANMINTIYGECELQSLSDDKASLHLSRPLVFTKTGLSLSEKLQILDAVQYMLFPALGVITFALDYITDRPVLLYLYDEPAVGGFAANSKIVAEKLKKSQLHNYFGVVQSLSSEEIYHETLAFYLRQDLPVERAAKLFKFIETEFTFSEKEELELIQSALLYIKEEHWTKIINQRFSADAKYRRLLQILPIKLRITTLKQTLEKVGKNLATYAPYHLAAINGSEIGNETAESLRELLKEAIRNSSSEALDQLQEDLRIPLYKELILIAYANREEVSSTRRERLRFRSTDKIDAHSQLILQALMARGENAFFECIRAFQTIDHIRNFLIDKILEGLEKNWCNWDITLTLEFWKSIPNKLSNIFLTILKYSLRNPTQYIALAEHPSEFKSFLLEGSAILNVWHSARLQDQEPADQGDDHRSLLNVLSALQQKRLSILLRAACLELSKPLTVEHIGFASWWLMSELVYTETDSFIKDYEEFLGHYRNNWQAGALKISSHPLFLLSGGRLGGSLSLIECCQKYDAENQRNYLDEDLLTAILNVWILQKIPIPTLDINYLVDKLPDEKSNMALTKIVLNDREEQRVTVLQLESQVALRWLKETDQLRMSYIVESRDFLFELLISLKEPSIELIRHMITVDPGAYPLRGGWKEYANYIKYLYERYWRVSFHDAFVEDYIALAIQLIYSPNIASKYRLVLRKLVEFRYTSQNTDSLLDENILNGLLDLTYENEEPTQDIQRRADQILRKFLMRPDLANLLSNLEINTLRALRNYSHLTEEKLLDTNIIKFLDNEYTQRGRRVSSIHVDTEYDPAILFDSPDAEKASPEPKNRKINNQDYSTALINDQPSINNAKTTFLEKFLILVLILFTTIIILEIWVAMNPTVFNGVWQIAQEFLTR